VEEKIKIWRTDEKLGDREEEITREELQVEIDEGKLIVDRDSREQITVVTEETREVEEVPPVKGG
jgi:hypothetical protein